MPVGIIAGVRVDEAVIFIVGVLVSRAGGVIVIVIKDVSVGRAVGVGVPVKVIVAVIVTVAAGSVTKGILVTCEVAVGVSLCPPKADAQNLGTKAVTPINTNAEHISTKKTPAIHSQTGVFLLGGSAGLGWGGATASGGLFGV